MARAFHIESVASYYDTPGARALGHQVKAGDPDSIAQMAAEMAPRVDRQATLVPVPGRTGRATTTLALAHAIAKHTGATVVDALRGTPRESLYHLKKTGQPLPALDYTVEGELRGPVVAIDHVAATGHTARAVRTALPEARFLVHSIDHTATHDPLIAKSLDGRDPIVAPAVRINGQVHTAPIPERDDDRLHMMHMDAALHAERSGAATREQADRELREPSNMGFVTRSGKYLSRKDAVPHVFAHDQFRIKNEKDSRLKDLKTRLKQQMENGHPDPILDSFDIDFLAKSYAFTSYGPTLHEEGTHLLTVDMTHTPTGQSVTASLARTHDMPKGHWTVQAVTRPSTQSKGEWNSRENIGSFGVTGVRALARHLRDTHGVTTLDGLRVTGARANRGIDAMATTVKLAKARASTLFRITTTPPADDGSMRLRRDPARGATYFANTEHGARQASQIGEHYDETPFTGVSAITRNHRIYGHQLPRVVSDERAKSRLAHFDRVADKAHHPLVADTIRHLARLEIDRPHRVVEAPNGKQMRVYQHRHAAIDWNSFENSRAVPMPHSKGVDPSWIRDRPWHSTSLMEGDQIADAYKDKHPHLKTPIQHALHHMGYHGAAITDEAGHWGNEYSHLDPNGPNPLAPIPRMDRSTKPRGSIAMLPTATTKMQVKHRVVNKFDESISTRGEGDAWEAKNFPVEHSRRFNLDFGAYADKRRHAAYSLENRKIIERREKGLQRSFSDVIDDLRKARGDALQPWMIRRKKGPLKFNEDPIEIVRSEPSPMRNRYNAPIAKSRAALTRRMVKALFDFRRLSRNVVPVEQKPVERSQFVQPGSFAKYDETVGRTLKAWNSAANRKRLDAGIKAGGHEWYHMDQLHHKFRERHGAEEGSRRFNLFMDTIAGTSHNSEFGVNMRRAGALFPFMVHGDPQRKLSRDEGLNHLLGPKLGNTAHREMAASLQAIREGRMNISKEPLKIDGFAPNLRGNHDPLTADRHVGRQSGHPGQTSNPTVYQGIEDATRHHAKTLADKGHLPVAEGRAPTAAFQSAVWVGDAIAGRVKSSPHPALVDFHHELTRTADRIGISHTEALDRFMDGHLHEFGGGAPGLREHIKPPLIKSLTDVRDEVAALKPAGVAAAEWKDGVAHEAEHKDVAPAKRTQAKIAAAHLKDDPHYYAKLKRAGIK